jgi:hypothetical protein
MSEIKYNFKKLGIGVDEDISAEVRELLNEAEGMKHSANLNMVLKTSESLKALKSKDIKLTAPIMKQGDNAVIFPHTINVIQGQAGSHKSRLAENLCAAFMKTHNSQNTHLDYKRTSFDSNYTVVYVDSERNLSEQLPYALQSIQLMAGFEKEEHPYNFEYISLLQVPRKDRFSTLNEYLTYVRESTQRPLFIVLDVSTDCIEDFNRTDKSMELIDLMNVAINEFDVTFLCLIHENPNSDKARGHFGTEIMNKSSTVMQVRFEKDAQQNDTNLIRVKYLKCRSTERFTPFYIKYCKDAKGLVLADANEIQNVSNARKSKAPIDDIIEFLELYLGDGEQTFRTDLLDKLCKDFDCSQRTIEDRLKEIIKSQSEIFNKSGESCMLSKGAVDKTVFYSLIKSQPF